MCFNLNKKNLAISRSGGYLVQNSRAGGGMQPATSRFSSSAPASLPRCPRPSGSTSKRPAQNARTTLSAIGFISEKFSGAFQTFVFREVIEQLDVHVSVNASKCDLLC